MGVEITTLVEHRCSVRHCLDLPVELRAGPGDRRAVPARVVNIGSGGACLELDVEYPSGRLVEVVGAGPGAWPALVVYREGTTVGIMFDRSRQQDVQALMKRVAGAARDAA